MFGSALLQLARSVCVSCERFFIVFVVVDDDDYYYVLLHDSLPVPDCTD